VPDKVCRHAPFFLSLCSRIARVTASGDGRTLSACSCSHVHIHAHARDAAAAAVPTAVSSPLSHHLTTNQIDGNARKRGVATVTGGLAGSERASARRPRTRTQIQTQTRGCSTVDPNPGPEPTVPVRLAAPKRQGSSPRCQMVPSGAQCSTDERCLLPRGHRPAPNTPKRNFQRTSQRGPVVPLLQDSISIPALIPFGLDNL
jgi:hypothetical protein